MKVDPEKYWDNIPREINRHWGDGTSEVDPPRRHSRDDATGEGNRKEFDYED